MSVQTYCPMCGRELVLATNAQGKQYLQCRPCGRPPHGDAANYFSGCDCQPLIDFRMAVALERLADKLGRE